MEQLDDPVAVGSGGESPRAAAFRLLAERHLYDSYRLAAAILGDPVAAEDAVHDAFETAWRKWSTLRDPALFEHWFSRIVVNLCRDRLRARARSRVQPIVDDLQVDDRDAFAGVHDRELVARGLARLGPDDQVLLALRYSRDLRVGDIARVLDVPPGTVMSRLHHATRRLREVLADGDGKATKR